jgi:replicative DNA helicase
MQTLTLNLRNRDQEGDPLPPVFHQLEAVGAKIRRGQVTMVAAAPGGGKSSWTSFWALNVARACAEGEVKGLYFSADCDKMTFGKSAVASVLNIHSNKAEKLLNDGDQQAWEKLEQLTDHMWISFQEGPSPVDIRQEVDAFAYVNGQWPDFIVVDNLMDVDASGGPDDERRSQDAVIDFLKRLGRETGAAIIVLLHVVGEYEDGVTPIPLKGLMNKVGKRARLVLTLYRADDNLVGCCVVKNTNGPARADASMEVMLPWIPEMAWWGTGKPVSALS